MKCSHVFVLMLPEASVCFSYLHAAPDDTNSVVHVLLPLKGHRILQGFLQWTLLENVLFSLLFPFYPFICCVIERYRSNVDCCLPIKCIKFLFYSEDYSSLSLLFILFYSVLAAASLERHYIKTGISVYGYALKIFWHIVSWE